MSTKTLTLVVLSLLLYIITTGISFVAFSKAMPATVYTPPKVDLETGLTSFDDQLPKTESCPLNGAMYSKQQRQWWEQHRPLGIMIENHEESRPQSGLSFADVVYEAVAEGGITRFLALFYCQDAGIVGPVRSARTYFLDFISEYGQSPLYAHVGGANTPGPANALGQIEDYGWKFYNDLNQIHDGDLGYPVFMRDYDRLGRTVATEHTMYSTTARLWNVAKEKKNLTNVDEDGNKWDEGFVKYTYKDDAKTADRPTAQKVTISFWEDDAQYDVLWQYDNQGNIYKRINGGKPHGDKNNDKQLTTKNIVVLFMRESNANDGYENNVHLLYKTKGTGKAIVFTDGKKIDATWEKEGRTDRTHILDKNGENINFNKGTLWFEILPLEGEVDVS